MLALGTLEQKVTLPSGEVADISGFEGLPYPSPEQSLLPGFMEQYLATTWGPKWPEIVRRGNYILETFKSQEYNPLTKSYSRPAVDKRTIKFLSIKDESYEFKVCEQNSCPQDGGTSIKMVTVGAPNYPIEERFLGF